MISYMGLRLAMGGFLFFFFDLVAAMTSNFFFSRSIIDHKVYTYSSCLSKLSQQFNEIIILQTRGIARFCVKIH